MYKFKFKGTREEFTNRLKAFRKAKKDFAKTIGVPAPKEIPEIRLIVAQNLKDEDFEFITEEEMEAKRKEHQEEFEKKLEKLKEKGTE